MLIEFTTENFRSLHQRQSLSMIASPAKELRSTNCFDSGIEGLPPLLKSAVVYGPNAAGKTNLLRAMHFMQVMVLTSANSLQQGQELNVKPFALSKKSRGAPSRFEVQFAHEGVRYQYGFALTKARVVEEWLIAYPSGRPQHWFERTSKGRTDKVEWKFGPKFKGPHKVWRDSTRPNALFLSTAVQLNNEQLRPIFTWFQQKLAVVIPGAGVSLNSGITFNLFADSEGKSLVLRFLHAADVGIDDINVKRQQMSAPNMAQAPTPMEGQVIIGPSGLEAVSVKATHKALDTGEPITFDITEESDGTQKLFQSAGAWLKVLSEGSALFLDELNNSLHPLIVRFLVELFHNREANKKNAQLIFSTHDTSILDKDIFRRDQIWFVEKDKSQGTVLFALSDFSPRKEEALERNYLKGRYGALPIVRDLGANG